MKKILLISAILIAFAFTINNSYTEGFENGFCNGYKYVKGEYTVCPVAPVAPVPLPNRNTYIDGYNRGFVLGIERAEEY